MNRDKKISYFDSVMAGLMKPLSELGEPYSSNINFSFFIARVFYETNKEYSLSEKMEFELLSKVISVCQDFRNRNNNWERLTDEITSNEIKEILPVIRLKAELVAKEKWYVNENQENDY